MSYTCKCAICKSRGRGRDRNEERRRRSGSKTGQKLERVDGLQEQEEMMMDWRTLDLDLELFEMGGRN